LVHAATELIGELVGVVFRVEADLAEPLPGMFESFLFGHLGAFETERDVFQHASVREIRIVLEHEAAIRTRAFDRQAAHQHRARGGRKVRGKAGDEPQHRALAAAAGAEHADELANVGLVLHMERHIVDGGEFLARAGEIRLANLIELNDAPECPVGWDGSDFARRGACWDFNPGHNSDRERLGVGS